MRNMRAGNFYKSILLTLLLPVSFVSCDSGLPPAEYAKWVRDYSNGLHKKKEISSYSFDIQYKPSDYIITNEFKGNLQDTAAYSKRKKELGNMQYFDLKISSDKGDFIKDDAVSTQEYQQRLYYFSFGFQKDISLVDGEETLPCNLFHFERSYNLSNARSFLLGFDKRGDEFKDKTLVINSKALGMGIVKIQFGKDDLTEIPQLKIKL